VEADNFKVYFNELSSRAVTLLASTDTVPRTAFVATSARPITAGRTCDPSSKSATNKFRFTWNEIPLNQARKLDPKKEHFRFQHFSTLNQNVTPYAKESNDYSSKIFFVSDRYKALWKHLEYFLDFTEVTGPTTTCYRFSAQCISSVLPDLH
jgi:hypothetical protein